MPKNLHPSIRWQGDVAYLTGTCPRCDATAASQARFLAFTEDGRVDFANCSPVVCPRCHPGQLEFDEQHRPLRRVPHPDAVGIFGSARLSADVQRGTQPPMEDQP